MTKREAKKLHLFMALLLRDGLPLGKVCNLIELVNEINVDNEIVYSLKATEEVAGELVEELMG